MPQLDELKKHLVKGKVYRRADLVQWTKSVDRYVAELTQSGALLKLSQGLYYCPKESPFGNIPPDECDLVQRFLKDERFLLTSYNAYNTLGVGTTQLYNQRIVYNHKRHGEIELGNRKFSFRVKPHFPAKITPEFLLIDLMNNLETLAEDSEALFTNISLKAQSMDRQKIIHTLAEYGNARAKKLLGPFLY